MFRSIPRLFFTRNSTITKPASHYPQRPKKTAFARLANGLRVASEPIFGEYCTLGVAIDSGARHTSFYPQGTCHFVEKLAYSKTLNYPSREIITKLLEESGAVIDCQSTPETVVFAASCHRRSAHNVLRLIADSVHRPLIEEEDVRIAGETIRYENEAAERLPECEPLLVDWIHEAAFGKNTLGLSKYCQSANVDLVRREHIYTYASQYFTPERIVVAGIGVEPEEFRHDAEQLFQMDKTIWAGKPSLLLADIPPKAEAPAQYNGGEIRMALGPSPFPNLAHLVLGFRGASVADPDFVPFCVLQNLLGGGGSFSSGGPGKGMYTRLYVDVLYHHGWIYNATAYNFSYSDEGVFCIRASGDPSKVDSLADVVLNEFHRLDKGVKRDELDRAKVQLKSQMMMNLEMRPVMFEDLARQILAHDELRYPQYYAEKIDQVRNEDIVRVARRMLNSKLALVAYGDLTRLPSYERISGKI